MSSPYRSEVESLRAEVARLRAERAALEAVAARAARQRAANGKLAAALVVLAAAALMTLRPWLNGPSDGKFWAAVVIVVGVAACAVASALGAKTS